MCSYETHGVGRGLDEGETSLTLILAEAAASAVAASKADVFSIPLDTPIALLVNPFQLGTLNTIISTAESPRAHAVSLARPLWHGTGSAR